MVISFIVKMLYALLPYFFNTKGFNATQGFAFFIAWIFFLVLFSSDVRRENFVFKNFVAYFSLNKLFLFRLEDSSIVNSVDGF